MNISIFLSLLFGLQIFYWIWGRIASKNVKGKEDYFLAGKTVRLFPLMMTFLATQVGGGLFMGSAEDAYQYGWPVLLYPLGVSLGLIVLGLGIGKRLSSFPVSTVAQVMEIAYQSSWLKKLVSVLSVVTLFMILVAQIVASAKFFSTIGFNNNLLFTAFWAIVIIYTVQGGLRAVISTDLVQATLFSAVFFVCFGLVASTSSFPSLQLEPFLSVSSKLCGWLLMPLLFMVIEQDMGQRCFAGASPKIVSKAALLAGIVTMVVCFIPVYFGTLARSIGLEVPPGSSVLMTLVAKMTSPWMSAFVGCAILAAIISTATSLINAIGSNLTNDFSQNLSLQTARILTACISIGAIFVAFSFNNVVDLLIFAYEFSVSALFIPTLFALFKKQGNLPSAIVSIVLGGGAFIFFRFVPIFLPKEIVSIALSFFGYVCSELSLRRKALT